MTKPAKGTRGGPRVLFLDIETKPMLGYVWSIWNQNIGLNQLHSDWSILSFAAKWKDDPASKMIYRDLAKARNIDDDRPLLTALWKLLDRADIVVAQNGLGFDKKKIFARFAIHGMQPPSTFKMIDTKQLAKKVFGFTSNRLEYLSEQLNKKYRKLKHEKFSGFELWRECMAGNQAAWAEMQKYNQYDVLALEELYHRLIPWDDSVSFGVYHDAPGHVCSCGSREFERRGFHYTQSGKFQRFRCKQCGAWTRGKLNLLSKEKRASLQIGAPR